MSTAITNVALRLESRRPDAAGATEAKRRADAQSAVEPTRRERRQAKRAAKQAAKEARDDHALPQGMGARLGTMLWFTIALGFTGFGNVTELAYMPLFGWLGVLVAMAMYALWRDRTRPKPNGFWILLGILWAALVILQIRPYLGLVATLPVALLWLHDSPATPTAMLTWGTVATIFQDFDVWTAADAGTAFYVVLAMVLFIGAAQAERARLARRSYAPSGRLWMTARLLAIFFWSITLVAGREAIRAINFFTYLGFDLQATSGKVTVLLLLLASIAMAAMLFRTRPYKYVDPYEQPVDERGRRVARDSRLVQPADFDEGPSKRVAGKKQPKPAAAKPGGLDFDAGPGEAKPATRSAKPAGKPAAKPQPKGPLKPGEIDFD